MGNSEREPKIFQLYLGRGFGRGKIECDPLLGPKLPRLLASYEPWRKVFDLAEDGNEDRSEVRSLTVGGRIKAFLFLNVDKKAERERLMVVGVTPKGRFASPQIIFEKVNSELTAFMISWQGAVKKKQIRPEFCHPWQRVVDRGDLINPERLSDLEDLLRKEGSFLSTIIQLKPADSSRRMELLEKWGVKFPFQTHSVYLPV